MAASLPIRGPSVWLTVLATALITGLGRQDRGVEREQVDALGDAADDLEEVGDGALTLGLHLIGETSQLGLDRREALDGVTRLLGGGPADEHAVM